MLVSVPQAPFVLLEQPLPLPFCESNGSFDAAGFCFVEEPLFGKLSVPFFGDGVVGAPEGPLAGAASFGGTFVCAGSYMRWSLGPPGPPGLVSSLNIDSPAAGKENLLGRLLSSTT